MIHPRPRRAAHAIIHKQRSRVRFSSQRNAKHRLAAFRNLRLRGRYFGANAVAAGNHGLGLPFAGCNQHPAAAPARWPAIGAVVQRHQQRFGRFQQRIVGNADGNGNGLGRNGAPRSHRLHRRNAARSQQRSSAQIRRGNSAEAQRNHNIGGGDSAGDHNLEDGVCALLHLHGGAAQGQLHCIAGANRGSRRVGGKTQRRARAGAANPGDSQANVLGGLAPHILQHIESHRSAAGFAQLNKATRAAALPVIGKSGECRIPQLRRTRVAVERNRNRRGRFVSRKAERKHRRRRHAARGRAVAGFRHLGLQRAQRSVNAIAAQDGHLGRRRIYREGAVGGQAGQLRQAHDEALRALHLCIVGNGNFNGAAAHAGGNYLLPRLRRQAVIAALRCVSRKREIEQQVRTVDLANQAHRETGDAALRRLCRGGAQHRAHAVVGGNAHRGPAEAEGNAAHCARRPALRRIIQRQPQSLGIFRQAVCNNAHCNGDGDGIIAAPRSRHICGGDAPDAEQRSAHIRGRNAAQRPGQPNVHARPLRSLNRHCPHRRAAFGHRSCGTRQRDRNRAVGHNDDLHRRAVVRKRAVRIAPGQLRKCQHNGLLALIQAIRTNRISQGGAAGFARIGFIGKTVNVFAGICIARNTGGGLRRVVAAPRIVIAILRAAGKPEADAGIAPRFQRRAGEANAKLRLIGKVGGIALHHAVVQRAGRGVQSAVVRRNYGAGAGRFDCQAAAPAPADRTEGEGEGLRRLRRAVVHRGNFNSARARCGIGGKGNCAAVAVGVFAALHIAANCVVEHYRRSGNPAAIGNAKARGSALCQRRRIQARNTHLRLIIGRNGHLRRRAAHSQGKTGRPRNFNQGKLDGFAALVQRIVVDGVRNALAAQCAERLRQKAAVRVQRRAPAGLVIVRIGRAGPAQRGAARKPEANAQHLARARHSAFQADIKGRIAGNAAAARFAHLRCNRARYRPYLIAGAQRHLRRFAGNAQRPGNAAAAQRRKRHNESLGGLRRCIIRGGNAQHKVVFPRRNLDRARRPGVICSRLRAAAHRVIHAQRAGVNCARKRNIENRHIALVNLCVARADRRVNGIARQNGRPQPPVIHGDGFAGQRRIGAGEFQRNNLPFLEIAVVQNPHGNFSRAHPGGQHQRSPLHCNIKARAAFAQHLVIRSRGCVAPGAEVQRDAAHQRLAPQLHRKHNPRAGFLRHFAGGAAAQQRQHAAIGGNHRLGPHRAKAQRAGQLRRARKAQQLDNKALLIFHLSFIQHAVIQQHLALSGGQLGQFPAAPRRSRRTAQIALSRRQRSAKRKEQPLRQRAARNADGKARCFTLGHRGGRPAQRQLKQVGNFRGKALPGGDFFRRRDSRHPRLHNFHHKALNALRQIVRRRHYANAARRAPCRNVHTARKRMRKISRRSAAAARSHNAVAQLQTARGRSPAGKAQRIARRGAFGNARRPRNRHAAGVIVERHLRRRRHSQRSAARHAHQLHHQHLAIVHHAVVQRVKRNADAAHPRLELHHPHICQPAAEVFRRSRAGSGDAVKGQRGAGGRRAERKHKRAALPLAHRGGFGADAHSRLRRRPRTSQGHAEDGQRRAQHSYFTLVLPHPPPPGGEHPRRAGDAVSRAFPPSRSGGLQHSR